MASVKEKVVLQANGREVDVDDVTEKAKEAFESEGHKKEEIKKVVVYLKSEENAAYYVINDEFTGRIDL